MKIIAHRGNLYGPDPHKENSIPCIENCIALNFDVEIDIWAINNNLFLGHDAPQYHVCKSYLLDRKNFLWIHCKNKESIINIIDLDLNFFFHDKDDFVITSKKNIWAYPGKKTDQKTVQVLPEWTGFETLDKNCYGICTDFPIKVGNMIKKLTT